MPFIFKQGFHATIMKWRERTNEQIEMEIEDTDPSFFQHKPVSIQSLLKSTQFTRRELQIIYRGFKEDCPTGQLTEDIFKVIYGKFFPQGDASMYAHHVFRTFDHANTGRITFEQLVRCLSSLTHGSTSSKLMWIFHLYDTDSDGVISKVEMQEVVGSIYDLLGKHTDPPYDETTMKDHMEMIFQKLDLNQDGVITPAEFLQACQNDPHICDALGCLQTCL